MKLKKIVDIIRGNIVWGSTYDKDEPKLVEPAPSRLKDRKPGFGDPKTTFSFWTDSSRFWYFYHDLRMSITSNLTDSNLTDDEIANQLEAAIIEYNWALLNKIDNHGLNSPFDRPVSLDHLKRESFEWIMEHAKTRCEMINAIRKERPDDNRIDFIQNKLKDERNILKSDIDSMREVLL